MVLILVLGATGCAPVPTPAPTPGPTPTTTSTATPTTPAPSATAAPLAEPTLGPTLTLQDLHAAFTYAVCQGGQCDVHVIDAEGVDRNITNTPEHRAEEHQPVFSPDGRRVSFRCTHVPSLDVPENGNDDLCVADVDGSHRRNLTDNDVADYSSVWSPDGRWIAFASGRGRGPDNPNDIYVMRPDGSEVRRITETVGIDEYPVWSNEGAFIAYSCTAGGVHPSGVGDFEACVVNVDGSDRRRLTATAGICLPLDWSGDDGTLLLGCDPDGNGTLPDDLYLSPLNAADGGGGFLVPLTDTGAFGAYFTPDGDSLIYKDTGDRFWRLTIDGSNVRSPIELPRIEADWDLRFEGE
jgi:dipeptidyl aminopeptidase/acylaminoacyl peptidase